MLVEDEITTTERESVLVIALRELSLSGGELRLEDDLSGCTAEVHDGHCGVGGGSLGACADLTEEVVGSDPCVDT